MSLSTIHSPHLPLEGWAVFATCNKTPNSSPILYHHIVFSEVLFTYLPIALKLQLYCIPPMLHKPEEKLMPHYREQQKPMNKNMQNGPLCGKHLCRN